MKYLTLFIAALGAIGTLGIMIWTSYPKDSADLVGVLVFVVWATIPFLVLIALGTLIYWRRSQTAQMAILFTTLTITTLSLWGYWASMFPPTSSTSGLVFIFVPIYSLVATPILYGLAWSVLRLVKPESPA